MNQNTIAKSEAIGNDSSNTTTTTASTAIVALHY